MLQVLEGPKFSVAIRERLGRQTGTEIQKETA